MDNSNTNDAREKYVCVRNVRVVQEARIGLNADAKKQHNQFVENNITMANNWIGVAGDSFLFASNTLAAFLAGTMNYYDLNQNLLGKYALTFEDIDKQLMEVAKIEEG